MQLTSGQQMDDRSKSASRTFFLDDLSVGQRFASSSHTIDAAQIKAFAAQFDPQPFHLDGEAAKATLFGGLAASGWHTAAITMKLLVESGLPLRGGIIGSGGEISWPKPTRPGDTRTVVREVEELTPSRSPPGRGMVRVRNESEISTARRCRFSSRSSSCPDAPRLLFPPDLICGRPRSPRLVRASRCGLVFARDIL